MLAARHPRRVSFLILQSTGMISWASEEYPFDNLEFAKRFTEEFMRDYFRLPDVVKLCREITEFYKQGQPTRCMMAT